MIFVGVPLNTEANESSSKNSRISLFNSPADQITAPSSLLLPEDFIPQNKHPAHAEDREGWVFHLLQRISDVLKSFISGEDDEIGSLLKRLAADWELYNPKLMQTIAQGRRSETKDKRRNRRRSEKKKYYTPTVDKPYL